MKPFAPLALALGLTAALSAATPPDPKESEFYTIEGFTTPPDCVAEVGAMDMLGPDKLAFGTRRGEIWVVDHTTEADISKATFTKYAEGLHEVLGLAAKDKSLYVTQRPEVTRLTDKDGDGRADLFDTVNADWNILGDYHEYAFGSRFDKEGNIWVVLCLTGSFNSNAPWRGWCVRITPDGKMLPTAAGIRSPGGIGFGPDGEVFYDDNQGPWNGSSSLKHLTVGSFQGNPSSIKWWDHANGMLGDHPLGDKPLDSVDKSRIELERKRNPKYVPPAVQLPHGRVGNSPTAWDWDESGKFGPFTKQLFIADQSFSVLNRVFLEKVNGVYQGACFPFLKGFQSGPIAVRMGPDATLYVGGSDRGWGARGGKPASLERVRWTGKMPFEVNEMRVKPDGFELALTQPVDVASAKNPASYVMSAYTWALRGEYGGPEVDQTLPKVEVSSVSEDGMTVRLKVTPMTQGLVHQIDASGLKNKEGQGLLHPVGYYTLNEVPK